MGEPWSRHRSEGTWRKQGACLFSKRLEKGRFVWPSAKDGKIALTPAQLAMLLEGEEDQKTIRGIVFPTQVAVATAHLAAFDGRIN